MVDAGRTHPRLILPTGQPKSVDAWSRAELVDPRVRLVLEKMDADLWPDNMATTKLIGASLLREFLEHRVAPLREHLLPLWKLGGPMPPFARTPKPWPTRIWPRSSNPWLGETWRGWRMHPCPCSFGMIGSRW